MCTLNSLEFVLNLLLTSLRNHSVFTLNLSHFIRYCELIYRHFYATFLRSVLCFLFIVTMIAVNPTILTTPFLLSATSEHKSLWWVVNFVFGIQSSRPYGLFSSMWSSLTLEIGPGHDHKTDPVSLTKLKARLSLVSAETDFP